MNAIKEISNKILNKISRLLGNTDISTIGDGTVTGAISAIDGDLSKCHINSDAGIEILLRRWSGYVLAGQTVCFGSIEDSIPQGKSLFGVFLSPRCGVHISMTYFNYDIYAYSETYTGEIEYDALVIIA